MCSLATSGAAFCVFTHTVNSYANDCPGNGLSGALAAFSCLAETARTRTAGPTVPAFLVPDTAMVRELPSHSITAMPRRSRLLGYLLLLILVSFGCPKTSAPEMSLLQYFTK